MPRPPKTDDVHAKWCDITCRLQLSKTFTTMPPVTKPSHEKYDYVIIGGGSGASGSGVCSFFFCLFTLTDCSACYRGALQFTGRRLQSLKQPVFLAAAVSKLVSVQILYDSKTNRIRSGCIPKKVGNANIIGLKTQLIHSCFLYR